MTPPPFTFSTRIQPNAHGMSRLTLAFLDKKQEKEFQRDHLVETMPIVRFAAILATITYLLFAATETIWGDPSTLAYAHFIRFGLVIPLMLLTVLSTFIRRAIPYVPFTMLALVIGVAASQFLLNVHNYPNIPVPLTDGYIFIIVASFTLLRFRFPHGVMIAVTVMLLMVMETILMGRTFSERLYEFIVVFTASIIGGGAGYGVDYYIRRTWVLGRIAAKERELELEAEALRSAQKIARTIAHEFNNPLTVIQSVYDLHIRSHEDELEGGSLLKKIPTTVDRMAGLVRNLLNITELHDTDYVQGLRFYDLNASTSEPGSESLEEDRKQR